jgi:release factor glutamine methyltransferase
MSALPLDAPAPHAVTLGDAVTTAAARLAEAGIAESRREARLLVALAAGLEPGVVLGYPERLLDAAGQASLAALLARRASREPFSRILGRRGFWSLDFEISPDTLDPRPDSETVIEAALAALPDRQAILRLVDLGTGTGCLLLALLSELPNATGIGIDLLPGAVAVARRNAAALRLGARANFAVGRWGEALAEKAAHLILCNPPYICSGEIESLAPEVARFEPRVALDGGPDGLGPYRELAEPVRRMLAPQGVAVFEIGAGQAGAVATLMAAAGLRLVAIRSDLAGVERCVVVTPQ